ncbi:MAG: hypothetical protein KF901_27450, partial [Myxococcales bacterium]|nr:hypothetical protein [Myxococcales bacterium]
MSHARDDSIDEIGDDDATGEVLEVHFGRAASCSSVGSVIDFLFVSTVAGAALVSSLAVLLAREGKKRDSDSDSDSDSDTDSDSDS